VSPRILRSRSACRSHRWCPPRTPAMARRDRSTARRDRSTARRGPVNGATGPAMPANGAIGPLLPVNGATVPGAAMYGGAAMKPARWQNGSAGNGVVHHSAGKRPGRRTAAATGRCPPSTFHELTAPLEIGRPAEMELSPETRARRASADRFHTGCVGPLPAVIRSGTGQARRAVLRRHIARHHLRTSASLRSIGTRCSRFARRFDPQWYHVDVDAARG